MHTCDNTILNNVLVFIVFILCSPPPVNRKQITHTHIKRNSCNCTVCVNQNSPVKAGLIRLSSSKISNKTPRMSFWLSAISSLRVLFLGFHSLLVYATGDVSKELAIAIISPSEPSEICISSMSFCPTRVSPYAPSKEVAGESGESYKCGDDADTTPGKEEES